jgi:hypothetical protein
VIAHHTSGVVLAVPRKVCTQYHCLLAPSECTGACSGAASVLTGSIGCSAPPLNVVAAQPSMCRNCCNNTGWFKGPHHAPGGRCSPYSCCIHPDSRRRFRYQRGSFWSCAVALLHHTCWQ